MPLNAPLRLADIPLVVGVTSHRNLAASEIAAIRERVRDFSRRSNSRFPLFRSGCCPRSPRAAISSLPAQLLLPARA